MAFTGSDNWTTNLRDLTPADKDHLVGLIQEYFQFLVDDFGYTSTKPETSSGHGVLVTLSYRNEACGMTIECGFGNYQVLSVRFEKEAREPRNFETLLRELNIRKEEPRSSNCRRPEVLKEWLTWIVELLRHEMPDVLKGDYSRVKESRSEKWSKDHKSQTK
jgi:hypothetical protein